MVRVSIHLYQFCLDKLANAKDDEDLDDDALLEELGDMVFYIVFSLIGR